MRMDRLARSTPRSQHYQQQDVYYQNERGAYQGEDDAIAQGARRSAKDGSQYMQRTQQEDLTVSIQNCTTSCLCFEKDPYSAHMLILPHSRLRL